MTATENILFALPGNDQFTRLLASKTGFDIGEMETRQFPDGETYLRVNSTVTGKKVTLVCTLSQADEKLLPLYFLTKTLLELGAKQITLVAPYLGYMRQDIRFLPGEAITSNYFGELLSGFLHNLITVDPHLHRYTALSEVYTIPSTVLHATGHMANWIHQNVENPILIGPDSESKQWVSKVAHLAKAPYLVLEKIRHGDTDVEVSVPELGKYLQHTPVLVDDIISTARTMIETVGHLKNAGMKPPVCVGVHAIFAGNAYQNLMNAGVRQVITSNTIEHPSNGIDISDLVAGNL